MKSRLLAWVAAFVLLTALVAPAVGQFVPGLSNPMFGVATTAERAPVTIAYVSNNSATADANSYTYTSQSIGTAASDRVVIVAAYGRRGAATNDISSITIGGAAATRIIVANNTTTGGNSDLMGVYALLVPSGTAADIVVTYTQTQLRGAVGVWAMYGTSGSVTARDSKSSAALASGNPTVNLLTGSNGALMAAVGDGSSPGTWSWTGASKDYQITVEAANDNSGAHANLNTSGTTVVTATASGTSTDPVLVAVSWAN